MNTITLQANLPRATFKAGRTIESNMHFAHKNSTKKCAWNHVKLDRLSRKA